MARAATKQAKQVFDESQGSAGQHGQNSNQLYGDLFPTLEAEATHPTGYDPGDLAAMNTAVGQTTGGATAAVKGEGMLDAARSGNRGGFQTALDDSAREGERTNANAALEIQGKNAEMREKKRQMGMAGLGHLYDENSADELKALGLSDEATKTGLEAGKSGWFQNLLSFMRAGSEGAATGKSIAG